MNLPAIRSASPSGPRLITNTSARTRRNTITRRCGHWHTSGYASSFDAGKTVNPMTSRYTRTPCDGAALSLRTFWGEPPAFRGNRWPVFKTFLKITLDGSTQKTNGKIWTGLGSPAEVKCVDILGNATFQDVPACCG